MTEALDKLPAGWSVTRVDRVATVNARIGWKALTAAEYQREGITFLSTPNIKSEAIDFDNVNYITEHRYLESPELKLAEGDVLLVKDGNTLGITNQVRHLPGPATVNGSIAVIRPQGIDSSYLRYVLASVPIQQKIQLLKGGMGVPHLFQWDINRLPVPLPPIDEQRRIAKFLDAETSRIDVLWNCHKQMRDLLSERWEAVVRAAVTGRIRAAAPNGAVISWLGAINSDWPVTSIGRVSSTYMGTTFPHAYQGSEVGDIPFIKVGDFRLADRMGLLSSASNWVTRQTARELGARMVPAQSIIYARVGAALLLNQRRLTGRESIVDDNVRGLAFRVGDPRYWRYLLTLLDLGKIANPGPVPSVSESQVTAVPIPFPPSNEQTRIANDLDDLNEAHLKLSENLSNQICLLQERRQALITAAVTGQVDVTTARGVD